jgi:DNA-binding beta-propeller fold protein YncE
MRRSTIPTVAWATALAVLATISGGLLAYRAWAADEERIPAPELIGGVAWLNTDEPVKLADLKGKIVVLDFWTLCCINCIHTLPDLAKLEKKYANEVVVIGVHSPKFANEKDTESIRKAILRYEIAHPVVNDADMKIWRRFGVNSWPTLAVITPDGSYLGRVSGEGHYELLDKVIAEQIKKYKGKGLDEKPRKFTLEREKLGSPLYFPGKVLADEKTQRLFIADSTNHRVVVTDLDGKHQLTIGAGGESGNVDGPFAKAQFNDPQGMAYDAAKDTLYIADRKNHVIKAADLKAGTVTTIAGTGTQSRSNRQAGGAALKTGLNSPWDLYLIGSKLYIAMAGHHQIWMMDLDKNRVDPYAGAGPENILDGSLEKALFAQPSGLASDGKTLFVADSEVSAIRAVPLNAADGDVTTIVGLGLFEFGDRDGTADFVRLQHALGVHFHDGKLYVADTYNSKIKIIDPAKRSCVTFLGGKASKDEEALFNEPAGLSYAAGKLYVADTNAHRIRVVDLKTKQVTTLPLSGVEAPKAESVKAP